MGIKTKVEKAKADVRSIGLDLKEMMDPGEWGQWTGRFAALERDLGTLAGNVEVHKANLSGRSAVLRREVESSVKRIDAIESEIDRVFE